MINRAAIALGAMLGLAIAGCATKQDTGRVIGGLAGAAAGSQIGDGSGQTLAIVAGALLGSAIGGHIGERMDREDRIQTAMALENNRSHETSTWRNPDTGHVYSVTPIETYQDVDRPCRKFELDVEGSGEDETVYGTACRDAGGTWELTG